MNRRDSFKMAAGLASMLALLTYPVVVEPALTVGSQALAWSTGYAVFVAVCVATALFSRGRMTAAALEEPVDTAPSPKPGWGECALWIGFNHIHLPTCHSKHIGNTYAHGAAANHCHVLR